MLPDTQPPPAGSEAAAPLGHRPRRRGLSRWQELPLLLVVAIVLALLVRTFLLQAFYIPSGSMAETLVVGDRVLVDKMVYRVRTPAVGEVVVFEGPEAWGTVGDRELPQGLLPRARRVVEEVLGVAHPGEEDYVKRVVGVGGDTVSCCDRQGRVVRNGVPLDEGYVADDSPLDLYSIGDCRGRRFQEVEVREGHLFVLGDHRRVSRDSRCHGQIPVENVIGRALAVVWPSDRWSVLTRPDTTPTSPRRRDGRGGAHPTPGLSRARKVVGSQSD